MYETPFHMLANYSPWMTLLVGLLAALSFAGTGGAIFRRFFGADIPSHYALPTSIISGLFANSLVLQLVGFSHLSSPQFLRALLFLQIGIGMLLLIASVSKRISSSWRDTGLLRRPLFTSKLVNAMILLLLLSLLANLLIALAPSTKSDEVYVYMHTPLRLLQDGGFSCERISRIHIASWIPQLHYQLIAAPFYAMGLTDAMNVVSSCLSVLFVFFILRTVYVKTGSAAYSLLIAFGFYAGLHSPVWHVTGGAGALSVLSMTILVYMTLDAQSLAEKFGAFRYLGMASLFSVAASASKLTYLPVSGLCLLICALVAWRSVGYNAFWRLFAVAASFWAIFYLPAFLWSWGASGFILGPMSDPANAAAVLSGHMNNRNLAGVIYEVSIAVAEISPLVWAGCFFFFIAPWARKERYSYSTAAVLFLVQIALFAWKLPLHFRYFGGLHFALALFFWANAAGELRERFAPLLSRRGLVRAAVALCLGPWLVMQVVYAAPFFPVVFGAEPATAFLEARTPFVADFRELDDLLPSDAVLLAHGVSMPIYAPRRVVHELREVEMLNLEGPIFTFGAPLEPDELPGYSRELVYKNAAAVHHAFRTPGRPPITGPLEVWRLTGPDGKKAVE